MDVICVDQNGSCCSFIKTFPHPFIQSDIESRLLIHLPIAQNQRGFQGGGGAGEDKIPLQGGGEGVNSQARGTV